MVGNAVYIIIIIIIEKMIATIAGSSSE